MNLSSVIMDEFCGSIGQTVLGQAETFKKNEKMKIQLVANARLLPILKVVLLLNLGAFIFGVFHMKLRSDVTDTHNAHASHISAGRTLLGDSNTNCPCTSTTSSSKEKTAEFKIPNIVHYIWYNTQSVPIKFNQMLSVLSAHKVLQPDVMYFHTDREPVGPYWEYIRNLPRFKVKYRDPPTYLFGEPVKAPMFYTSHSNVDRVKILMEYGGIYLDFDVLVTRPFDDLRRHSCVIGMETETKACGSVILCEKSSFFLTMWINSYLDDYRMEEWAYNTGQVPANLARRYPHLCHVEKYKLNRPNFKELDRLWGPNRFNWTDNYAVHTWYRIWKDMSPYYNGIEPDPETIKTMNNTFGEMARTIYFGHPQIIKGDVD